MYFIPLFLVAVYVIVTIVVNLSFAVSLLPLNLTTEERYGVNVVLIIASMIACVVLRDKIFDLFFSETLLYSLVTGVSMWVILSRKNEKESITKAGNWRKTGRLALLLGFCMGLMTLLSFTLVKCMLWSWDFSLPFD